MPVRSKMLPATLVAVVLLAPGFLALAEESIVTGRITSFECGDNCYLTITSESGEEHVGLCAAPECVPWNEVAEMPADMVDRNVVATTAIGTQFDGNGDAVAEMLAFEKLDIAR